MSSNPYFEAGAQRGVGGVQQQEWGQPAFGRQQVPAREQAVSPPVDIIDNTEEVWVYIDLPGFKKEEIHVHGDTKTLVLSAERPTDIEEGRTVLLHERPSRAERAIPLPAPVEIAGARASYESGVCKVTLPKTVTEQYQRIEFK